MRTEMIEPDIKKNESNETFGVVLDFSEWEKWSIECKGKFNIVDIKELKDGGWKLSVKFDGRVIDLFFSMKKHVLDCLNELVHNKFSGDMIHLMMYAHLVLDVTSNKVLKSRYSDVGEIPTYSEFVFDFVESKSRVDNK